MFPEASAFKKDWQSAQKTLRKSEENCAFVYLHRKADSGDPFYVGMGEVHTRPWTMSHRSRTDWHRNIVQKHGVIVEIIAKNLSWEAACFWEVSWIKALKNEGYKLTNLSLGGDAGMRGRKHSAETKAVMSLLRKNVPKSEDHKHKIKVANLKHGDKHHTKTESFKDGMRGDKNVSKRQEVVEKIKVGNSKHSKMMWADPAFRYKMLLRDWYNSCARDKNYWGA